MQVSRQGRAIRVRFTLSSKREGREVEEETLQDQRRETSYDRLGNICKEDNTSQMNCISFKACRMKVLRDGYLRITNVLPIP